MTCDFRIWRENCVAQIKLWASFFFFRCPQWCWVRANIFTDYDYVVSFFSQASYSVLDLGFYSKLSLSVSGFGLFEADDQNRLKVVLNLLYTWWRASHRWRVTTSGIRGHSDQARRIVVNERWPTTKTKDFSPALDWRTTFSRPIVAFILRSHASDGWLRSTRIPRGLLLGRICISYSSS